MKDVKAEQLNRIKKLVTLLNDASRAYYAKDEEIMSNLAYDSLYDELVKLEEETGIVLANSPTITVGYEAVEELPKEKHERPMLSLGKTKSREELQDWVKDKLAILSWKLDGLTVVLTYNDGKLAKAVTRGNGEIGEVITNNAKTFTNIPLSISFKGELILRGEAVISYSDFEKINDSLPEDVEHYKNPRNLCSGSVRQLNNQITAQRKVRFIAFNLVKADGVDFSNSREKQFKFLEKEGFQVVDRKFVTRDNILKVIGEFEELIKEYEIPSDGLVLCYDDIAYGQSLGRTAKFPRDSIAFKWADELRETTLREIEWSPSRTGLINPVAIFDAVELEGTSVSRASVHNVSILEALMLGEGDTITVYKANMIIPQIAENLTQSGTVQIPKVCPVCGGKTEIKKLNEVKSLYCINLQCQAKKIKSYSLFVSRDAFNVDGLSEATLEKFIAKGFIHEYADIFKLARYKEEIIAMDGMGEKSFQKLMDRIEEARKVTLPRLIYSLGIANIGLANAKMICREFGGSMDAMRKASLEELSNIDGVGAVIASAFVAYFEEPLNNEKFDHLLEQITILVEQVDEASQTLTGQSFVITGSLTQYENRNVLKEEIEKKGGKVTGSVTSKTTALINNDSASSSSKNKKAKELSIPIVTEEEFLRDYFGQ